MFRLCDKSIVIGNKLNEHVKINDDDHKRK
jgi:hypothetical protein